MPHQVVKCTSRGSVGDLARITDDLRNGGYNIHAIGGGEGLADRKEVGVVAMILEPDDDAHMADIVDRLRKLDLDGGRKLAHVENFPHIEIDLDDQPGQLGRAAAAVAGINIMSVITVFNQDGRARVSLGFRKADWKKAFDAIDGEGIPIHPHDHH